MLFTLQSSRGVSRAGAELCSHRLLLKAPCPSITCPRAPQALTQDGDPAGRVGSFACWVSAGQLHGLGAVCKTACELSRLPVHPGLQMRRELPRARGLLVADWASGWPSPSSTCPPAPWRRPRPSNPPPHPSVPRAGREGPLMLAQAPHLVREWWLELADVQGADQGDTVRGSPILVPGVFARLPGEAAAQLHHGGCGSSSCPEADTGSLPTGHPADVHAGWLWSERVLGWTRCSSPRARIGHG